MRWGFLDGILRSRLAHFVKLTRTEPKHMATLQGVLDFGGLVVAGEFEGRMLDYEARWACQKRLMLNTMAYSFADRSGMNGVPQRGWTYFGGE